MKLKRPSGTYNRNKYTRRDLFNPSHIYFPSVYFFYNTIDKTFKMRLHRIVCKLNAIAIKRCSKWSNLKKCQTHTLHSLHCVESMKDHRLRRISCSAWQWCVKWNKRVVTFSLSSPLFCCLLLNVNQSLY